MTDGTEKQQTADRDSEGRTWRPVCQVEELAQGAIRVVELGADEDGLPREALVLQATDGAPHAYVNCCKHLPIPLDSGTGDFLTEDGAFLLCSTHGARYRLEDGYCVDGPCEGERLDRLELRQENGRLYVRDRQ